MRKILILLMGTALILFAAFACDPKTSGKDDITVSTESLANGFKGTVYTPVQLEAAGGDDTAYSWQVTSGTMPAGLTLSAAGEISGTPTEDGEFIFTVQVSDAINNPGTQELSIQVDAIAISPATLTAAQKDEIYSATISASGGQAPYTFTLDAGNVPSGLGLAVDGSITGTPDTFEVCDFTVLVTDNNGAYNEHDYTLSVISGVPVEIDTTSCANGFINGTYSETVSASGGQGTYTWTISAGTLPAGLSINPSTGEISGTPSSAGSSTFTVRATDDVETANYGEQEFTIVIRSAVSVTTTVCDNGFEGGSYSESVAATGGSGTYTWSIASGALPTGLSINPSTGEISGTSSAAGTFNFTVKAEDSENPANSDNQALSIVIGTAVSITTATLPSVGGNIVYSETLGKTGGSGSYTWSIDSGSLPQDVTLGSSNGIISGYPGKPGTYTFTIRCADSANSNNYDTQSLSIEVTNFEWTLMIYLDGDNNLEPFAFADINEIEAADLQGYGIKVIVVMDGNGGYYSETSAFSGTRLYEITYDSAGDATTTGIQSTRLASTALGLSATGTQELNMADPATATNFITFVKSNYAADDYSLIFWNHGDGWRSKSEDEKKDVWKAVCSDDTSSDILSTKEIGQIVSGQGLSLIGFDACLLGMMEVAYELKADAEVMVGSEENEPGDGWEYDTLLNNFKAKGTKEAEDLGESIVTAYQTRYAATAGTTLSAIRLSEMDNLVSALETFITGCNSAGFETVYAAINSAGSVQRFGGDGEFMSHLDIWDLADTLSSVAGASALKTAVEDAVIQNFHYGTAVANAHGIALYFPMNNDVLGVPFQAYSTAYLDFAGDGNWDEFIHTIWRGNDAYEPNDNFLIAATTISDGINYNAYIQFPGDETTEVWADQDIYKFYVTANGTFTFNLSANGNSDIDAVILLIHESDTGTVLTGADSTYMYGDESFSYNTTTGAGTGWYYVIVMSYGLDEYDRTDPYTINVVQGTATIQ
ncbi:MAG: putative Ig domain-containing protein [Spirochaetales bacterium]|nr:putative Ig domain-containing protein [Spirochaetales bacterium]